MGDTWTYNKDERVDFELAGNKKIFRHNYGVARWHLKIYVVCSESIANFEFSRITHIRFSIFCGVMLVLISLTYTDKFGHFECSVNFWQLFCLDVFWVVFDFCFFSFGNNKKHRGQIWGIRWLQPHYCVASGQKFAHKQRCVRKGVIMLKMPIFVLPQIAAFLAYCFAQIAYNLQVIFLVDRSTMKIW